MKNWSKTVFRSAIDNEKDPCIGTRSFQKRTILKIVVNDLGSYTKNWTIIIHDPYIPKIGLNVPELISELKKTVFGSNDRSKASRCNWSCNLFIFLRRVLGVRFFSVSLFSGSQFFNEYLFKNVGWNIAKNCQKCQKLRDFDNVIRDSLKINVDRFTESTHLNCIALIILLVKCIYVLM